MHDSAWHAPCSPPFPDPFNQGKEGMLSITPVRARISERFPVASFVVTVPPDRYFEVACTTDPRLFRAENRHARRATNFATSRMGGLLRAPAGEATYIVPPQQLRRFAGARRLYYAVAAYRGARNEDPVLTLSNERLQRTPSIQISPDFTGRCLDRGRIGKAEATYGGEDSAGLAWGGDDVLSAPAPRGGSRARIGEALGDPSTEIQEDPNYAYDDGFDAALWNEKDEDEGGETYAGGARPEPPGYGDPAELATIGGAGPEPHGYGDAVELAAIRGAEPEPHGYGDPAELATIGGVEPSGFEDALSMQQGLGQQYLTRFGSPVDEPSGVEDAQELGRVFGSRPVPPSEPLAAAAARYGGAVGPHHERYGSVKGGARPFVGSVSGAGYGGGDIEGFEDVPSIVRHLGEGARLGEAARMPAPRATSAPGHFPDYSDDPAGPEALPDVAPPVSEVEVFTPADPRHRLRVLDRVARVESGSEGYRAVAGDERVGVAIGYVKFAQRYGALGHLLRVCLRRDRDAYVRLFGESHAAPPGDDLDPSSLPVGHLLRVTLAANEAERLLPVLPPGGAEPVPLWREPWVGLFRQAGEVVAFQEAQREVADRRFYLPYLDVLRWLGVDSLRGHAMFVDRSVQMGGGAAVRWVVSVAGPIRSRGDLARALAHLGHADLQTFQATLHGRATGPFAEDSFGPFTHAALCAALRARGDSPLPIRSESETLAELCVEAHRLAESLPPWREAAQRLDALHDDPALVRLLPEHARGAV